MVTVQDEVSAAAGAAVTRSAQQEAAKANIRLCGTRITYGIWTSLSYFVVGGRQLGYL
jgi:hypothetical protein